MIENETVNRFLSVVEPRCRVMYYVKDNDCFGNQVVACCFNCFEIRIICDRGDWRIDFLKSTGGLPVEYPWEEVYRKIASTGEVLRFDGQIAWLCDHIDHVIRHFDGRRSFYFSYDFEKLKNFFKKIPPEKEP